MRLRCSACHHRFEADPAATEPRCPNCAAEAGLEPVEGAALPMKLFGALLFLVVVVAIAGNVLGRVST